MKQFVFWTGMYNILLAISSLIPAVAKGLGLAAPDSRFYVWLPGILIIYLGVMLILASRDLEARASLVFWEGILRVGGFVVALRYGFFGEFGASLGMVGVIDLIVGLVYIIGLPRVLNRSMVALLLDRKSQVPRGTS
jgi:hypothetical protein